MTSHSKKEILTNVSLLVLLGACLWIGWSDFFLEIPEVTQEEIRESIRFYIRTSIQVAVKFVIPTIVLTYFAKKFLRGRSKT